MAGLVGASLVMACPADRDSVHCNTSQMRPGVETQARVRSAGPVRPRSGGELALGHRAVCATQTERLGAVPWSRATSVFVR